MFALRSRQASRRRWALSLIAFLALHWIFGACTAIADVRCLEPSGRIVLEKSGNHCVVGTSEHPSGKHCVDFPVDDNHEDQSSSRLNIQLADAHSPGLSVALPWLASAHKPLFAMTPDATGPPSIPLSILIRETTYLLI